MGDMFNFPEMSDFPRVCTATSTMKFGIDTLQKVLEEHNGLSDELVYRLKTFIEAYNNLAKACVPEGCTI